MKPRKFDIEPVPTPDHGTSREELMLGTVKSAIDERKRTSS